MANRSGSKKVARAARAGGRTKVRSSQGRVFPAAIAIVVALGVAVVAYGKLTLSDRASASPPTRNDHWHTAFGVYVCDAFLPSFSNENDIIEGSIPWGIHTHADGIIHVHPFTSAAAGENADLGAYFRAIDVEVTDDELRVPANEAQVVAAMPGGSSTLTNGATCGDQPGRWQAAYWTGAADEEPAALYEEDFGSIRLQSDRSALTLAFVPEGTEVPKPPSIPTLDALTDVGPASATTIPGYTANPDQAPVSTVPGETTVAGVPGETTAATVPGETTETTVAPAEATETTVAPPTEATAAPAADSTVAGT